VLQGGRIAAELAVIALACKQFLIREAPIFGLLATILLGRVQTWDDILPENAPQAAFRIA
jgi:hypothetical protein